MQEEESCSMWAPLMDGAVLQVTVKGCTKLKGSKGIIRTQFIKHDTYVCLDYLGLKFRTTACRTGNDPSFNQKFYFRLIEGADELEIHVVSKRSMTADTVVGSGRVYLSRVLNNGRDTNAWPILDKRNRFAGEVELNMVLLSHCVDVEHDSPGMLAIMDDEHWLQRSSCHNNINKKNEGEGAGAGAGAGLRLGNMLFEVCTQNLSCQNLLEKVGTFLFTRNTQQNNSSNMCVVSIVIVIVAYLFWHS